MAPKIDALVGPAAEAATRAVEGGKADKVARTGGPVLPERGSRERSPARQ
ncbi:MAG: hypothetical protein ABSG53_27785 [Thermoguttaceae bacterium]